jgi:hypothetical protein
MLYGAGAAIVPISPLPAKSKKFAAIARTGCATVFRNGELTAAKL